MDKWAHIALMPCEAHANNRKCLSWTTAYNHNWILGFIRPGKQRTEQSRVEQEKKGRAEQSRAEQGREGQSRAEKFHENRCLGR